LVINLERDHLRRDSLRQGTTATISSAQEGICFSGQKTRDRRKKKIRATETKRPSFNGEAHYNLVRWQENQRGQNLQSNDESVRRMGFIRMKTERGVARKMEFI